MRASNTEYVVAAATHEQHDGEPFAKAVRESIEVGIVVPSKLRVRLEANGFDVVDDTTGTGAFRERVQIFRDGELVAMGASADRTEALLAAALGWFREHPIEELEAPAGLTPV